MMMYKLAMVTALYEPLVLILIMGSAIFFILFAEYGKPFTFRSLVATLVMLVAVSPLYSYLWAKGYFSEGCPLCKITEQQAEELEDFINVIS